MSPRAPLVSVVMTVHNAAAYFQEAMDSILVQSLTDFELIVVDDASTDATSAILASVNDPRVVTLRNDRNIGQTRSLVRGLESATGQYIARHDADDRSLPGRFARQVDALEINAKLGAIGSQVRGIDESGRFLDTWNLPVESDRIGATLLAGNCLVHGAVMLRASALKSVGGYREKFRYAQDYDLWLRLVDKWPLANLTDVLYQFRRGPRTVSRRNLFAQNEFALVARSLAKERREKGQDSYEKLGTDPGEMLTSYFGFTGAQLRTAHCDVLEGYVEEAFDYADFLGAVGLRARIVSTMPSYQAARRLARDCVRAAGGAGQSLWRRLSNGLG
jgi:glycosyltransferase involved in cell wall biosynthesis